MLPAIAVLTAACCLAVPSHQRDLDVLLESSSVVVRARVLPGSEGADGFDLEVLASLKGNAPARLSVRSDSERPLRPAAGEQGVFFLATAEDSGKLVCIQGAAERWNIEPGSEAQTDAFIRSLLAKPDENERVETYLAGLSNPSQRLAAFAGQRLALWARQQKPSAEQWDRVFGFLSDPAGADEVKAGLVTALGSAMPLERVLALAPNAPADSRTRAALLAVAAAGAANAEPALADRARGALGAARQADSPEVAMTAAYGLASLGDEAALPAALGALGSADPRARAEAVLVLARLSDKGSAAARAQLKKLESDSDPMVAKRARAALRKAYFADPVRVRRTRGGLYLAGVAVVMLVGAAIALRRGSRPV